MKTTMRIHRFHSAAALGAACLLAACPSDDTGTTGPSSSTSTGGTSTDTGVAATTLQPTTMSPTSDTSTGSADTSTGAGESTSTGSAASTSTGAGAVLPDIDMVAVVDVITESAYTQTVNFAADSCALAEACVTSAGDRRLLRFDTWTPNISEVDLIVGNPNDDPDGLFEFGECHGHSHFLDYASYRVLDSEGNVAAVGHKQAFALIDFQAYSDNAGPAQFPLQDGTQGISAGWADIYGAYLDCQWVDITGVPPGDYTLEISVNPEEVIEEANYDNNIALIPVTIGKTDDVGPVLPPPPEWTCEAGFFSSNDGCDCGCGAVDPDCTNPTAAACEYCDNPGACSTMENCSEINVTNNAICM